MNLQAINNIKNNIQQPLPKIQDENPTPRAGRTFTPVSYATADGGLFVGYYLNIHG